MTKHTLEPVQYLYRDHFVTREDAADYVVDPAVPNACGWMVTVADGPEAGIMYVGRSVDDCMAAIDAVVDDD